MATAKKAAAKKPPCMVCKKRPVLQRKVCSRCLQAANRMIKSGQITEQQAIDAGLIGNRARFESDWMKKAKEVLPEVFAR